MKMKILFVLLFINSLCCAADQEAQEIKQLLNSQVEAWNRGDLDDFVKPYDDSGRLVFIGASGPVRNPQVLKDRYEKRYGEGQNEFGKLSFSETQVELLDEKVARVYGRWSLQQKEEITSGWFSLILYKTAQGWRIIHDHSS
jgi:hypothetical protein